MKRILIYQLAYFFFTLIISTSNIKSQDFQVNDNTGSSDQILPRIATDGYINFIVVWQDNRNGNSDIYCQLYDCSGTKQGDNFKINEDTEYKNQCSPTVAIDANGNFVIVWRDDSDQSIYGQCYSSNGTKLGNNFKISETIVPSYENHPAIAMDINGNFVVAWHDLNLLHYCQRYNNEGIKQGNNFLLDGSGANQYYPDIVMDENGNFIVAWGDNRDYRANDIYCRMFNYDGTSMSTSFLVSDPLAAYQSDPRIAIDGNGNYVVVWEDTRNEPSWNFGDVYGQRISSNGALIGSNFKVNDNTDYTYQAGAAIAVNKNDGRFWVVWDDYRFGWGNPDIYGRIFSSDGQPTQPSLRINHDIGIHLQHSVDIVWVKNRAYIAWTDNRMTDQGKDIFLLIEVFNSPPVADAGEDQTISCAPSGSIEVVLNGSGSSDLDEGDVLTYTWTEGETELGTGETLTLTLTPVVHTITLTVDDGNGGIDDDEVVIAINADTEPPVITAISDRIILWPPNHKYETINVSDLVVSVSDNCADLSVGAAVITKTTSDEEEDAYGGGDGNTDDDIAFPDGCSSVDLRAERQGNGNGRVYTIHLAVADDNGNQGTATCLVQVPHDKKDTAVDDGVLYEEVCNCGLGKHIRNNQFVSGQERLSEGYALLPNYPNPFNPTTTISYALPQGEHVRLQIFDINGQLVKELLNGYQAAGIHSLDWNAQNAMGSQVASGIYFCRMMSGEVVLHQKLILTK